MKKLTTEDIIKKAKKIYGNKYDLSKIEYINYNSKITVICPTHGEFSIRTDHFLEGKGCPKCGNKRGADKLRMTKEKFIEKSHKIHGDKYDYSKVEYINAKTKVCIVCPKHGEFWVTPYQHKKGVECPKCTHQSYKYTTEEFILKAREIHGDRYDYSKVEYKGRLIPVCIICPIHGEFWQKPSEHFKGHGCQKCNESVLEKEIKLFLEVNKIEYEQQKKFSWLKNKYPLSLDFYLPKYEIGIECQGEQHFKDREFFNKNQSFDERLEIDLLKNKQCNDNGIKLLYYSSKYIVPKNWDKYDVICSKSKLLNKINGKDRTC